MRLGEKVAIITGGARGIGKAFALRLSKEGARVAVADVLDCKEVVNAIVGEGREALGLYTDVSKEESTQEMARRVVERFGRIDILVNNAAIMASLGNKPFHEIPVEEWDEVMRVNLKGPFLCSKAVYPQMKRQKKGKIINISSGTFFKGAPYLMHYAASKGGVIGITRCLASELGNDGICVNAIAPGLTLSEAVKGNPVMFSDDSLEISARMRCIKRKELPEDLTGTIVFLSSDDSDFITGQTFCVDGGSVFH